MRKKVLAMAFAMSCALAVAGCRKNTDVNGDTSSEVVSQDSSKENETTQNEQETVTDVSSETDKTQETQDNTEESKGKKKVNYTMLFNGIERTECFKGIKYNNPLITQEYGADPNVLIYDDTLYVYMTQDEYEKAADGTIKDNSYGKIKTIRVISTKDMVNWTDHGEVYIGRNANGVGAKWANNSWAPAAAWKNIDGKDQFFLYFADGGGGIGVLQGDSPVGPFRDPIGKGLIRRDMPNCNVLWLFDPAVLVDDDGKAYIYFGGGVPQDNVSHPMQARVAQLGDDMISIVGEPVVIDAPYLFEDSGIHKYNNKYYYTYCTNWQVDKAGTDEYGFTNAEIACMESDSPLGPFVYKETILDNPGKKFGLYGNNHHAVFEFRNQWYITYHTRVLEKEMGVEKGYRCTFINKFDMGEDGTIGRIKQTLEGCEQLQYVEPYEVINACTFSHQAGLEVVPAESNSSLYGAGVMALSGIDSGDYFKVTGVDFSYKEPTQIVINAKKTEELDENCVIEVRLDSFKGDVVAYIPVGEALKDADIENGFKFTEITTELKKSIDGVHNIYFTFSGSGYQLRDWKFVGTESSWYDECLQASLTSAGSNGRLEKVLERMKNGEEVNVGFIGGSVTEGANATKVSESYADQTVANLQKLYPNSKINYVDAGLGGTPSALGIMRYDRDIVDEFGGTPDILFIEFSVNDYEEVTDGRAFESLIRTALEADEKTAVVLVFAVFQSKWNMQDKYIPMGELYGLPMVSIKDGTKKAFETGKLTDEKYFSDKYHPTSYGHTIMADCMTYMFEQVAAKEVPETISPVPEICVLANSFQGNVLVTSEDFNGTEITVGGFDKKDTKVHAFTRNGKVTFPDNWMHDADSSADAFEMKLTCKTLLINYKQSSSKNAGIVEVLVDGEVVKELDCYNESGWNQSIVDLIIDDESAAEHTVVIRMKEGDESKEFTILALGYTK